jgi:hypothetical protein
VAGGKHILYKTNKEQKDIMRGSERGTKVDGTNNGKDVAC